MPPSTASAKTGLLCACVRRQKVHRKFEKFSHMCSEESSLKTTGSNRERERNAQVTMERFPYELKISTFLNKDSLIRNPYGLNPLDLKQT